MIEVTFREFSKLMATRKRTVDDLVDLFRGKMDDSRAFFERAMSCQWRNPETNRYDDRGNVVIPYRSVIAFYEQELHYLEEAKREEEKRAEKYSRAITEEQKEKARQHMIALNARKRSQPPKN